MVYMNQERKAIIQANIKPILKKYGLNGSLSVRNHMTICLTITSGPIDFIGNSNEVCGRNFYQVQQGFKPNTQGYEDVNVYWCHDHYDGVAKDALLELIVALKSAGWYNNTRSEIDYFDTAYYYDIKIGSWQKPYQLI